ncbi:hypothetical protein [Mediterraneibacter sp.]|uniref:hypothetical protein n=1 Tax=Mediterraneibacter sp. TaxID=2316022 RepID=UPI00399318DB
MENLLLPYMNILACDIFDPKYAKTLLQRKLKDRADKVIASIIGYKLPDDQSVKMKVCRKRFDYINECISILDEKLSDLSKSCHEFIEFDSTIPGVTEQFASYIIAEVGTDMTIFKSLKHLCS